MTEKQLERKFLERLKEVGLSTIKLSTNGFRGSAGWPDRLVLLPGGRVAFVELKAPGNQPTALQRERIRQLGDLDLAVGWADSVEAAMAIVNAAMHRPRRAV